MAKAKKRPLAKAKAKATKPRQAKPDLCELLAESNALQRKALHKLDRIEEHLIEIALALPPDGEQGEEVSDDEPSLPSVDGVEAEGAEEDDEADSAD